MDKSTKIQDFNHKYAQNKGASRIQNNIITKANTQQTGNQPFLIPSNLFPPASKVTTLANVNRVVRPVSTAIQPVTTVVTPQNPIITRIAPMTTSIVPTTPIKKHIVDTVETHQTPHQQFTSHFEEGQTTPDYWEPTVVASEARRRAIDVQHKPQRGCCQKCNNMCPRCCGCPWWLCLLLGLIFLFAVLIAVGFGLKLFDRSAIQNMFTIGDRNNTSEATSEYKDSLLDQKEQLSCRQGYFLHKNKCLKCPGQSSWNGTNCVKREIVEKTYIARIIRNSSGEFVIENKTLNGDQGWTTASNNGSALSTTK